MNANVAFVEEQKSRVNEIADLLIVIQASIQNGNVAPQAIANSIGITIDALQGVASALNSVASIARAADAEV